MSLRRRLTIIALLLATLPAIALIAYIQTETGNYLYRGAIGHFGILASRQPIAGLLEDPALDPAYRSKLQLVLEVRNFARDQLAMPQARGYTSLAVIGRAYPGWNVYAAPAFSVVPHRWCFPVVGCVVYRGYFSKDEALAFAAQIRRTQQLDTYVAPFIGYSSLGYFDEPLLDSQLRLNPWQLAALVIHELAHQQLYLPGKSKINEAFARLVEREGVKRWLQARGDSNQIPALEAAWRQSSERTDMVIAARDRLDEVYRSNLPKAEKLARKQVLLLELHRQLCGAVCDGLQHTDFTNARLVPYITYGEELAEMYRLFAQSGNSFPRFYQLVRQTYDTANSPR